MMNRAITLFLSAAILLCGLYISQATTVVGSIRDVMDVSYGGQFNTMQFTPLSCPQQIGSNTYWPQMRQGRLTNGLFIVNLVAGTYYAGLVGDASFGQIPKTVRMIVPPNVSSISFNDAMTLATNGFQFIFTNGLYNLQAGDNIYFTTNSANALKINGIANTNALTQQQAAKLAGAASTNDVINSTNGITGTAYIPVVNVITNNYAGVFSVNEVDAGAGGLFSSADANLVTGEFDFGFYTTNNPYVTSINSNGITVYSNGVTMASVSSSGVYSGSAAGMNNVITAKASTGSTTVAQQITNTALAVAPIVLAGANTTVTPTTNAQRIVTYTVESAGGGSGALPAYVVTNNGTLYGMTFYPSNVTTIVSQISGVDQRNTLTSTSNLFSNLKIGDDIIVNNQQFEITYIVNSGQAYVYPDAAGSFNTNGLITYYPAAAHIVDVNRLDVGAVSRNDGGIIIMGGGNSGDIALSSEQGFIYKSKIDQNGTINHILHGPNFVNSTIQISPPNSYQYENLRIHPDGSVKVRYGFTNAGNTVLDGTLSVGGCLMASAAYYPSNTFAPSTVTNYPIAVSAVVTNNATGMTLTGTFSGKYTGAMTNAVFTNAGGWTYNNGILTGNTNSGSGSGGSFDTNANYTVTGAWTYGQPLNVTNALVIQGSNSLPITFSNIVTSAIGQGNVYVGTNLVATVFGNGNVTVVETLTANGISVNNSLEQALSYDATGTNFLINCANRSGNINCSFYGNVTTNSTYTVTNMTVGASFSVRWIQTSAFTIQPNTNPVGGYRLSPPIYGQLITLPTTANSYRIDVIRDVVGGTNAVVFQKPITL